MDVLIQEIVNGYDLAVSIFAENFSIAFKVGAFLFCLLFVIVFVSAIVFGIVTTIRDKILDFKNGKHNNNNSTGD